MKGPLILNIQGGGGISQIAWLIVCAQNLEKFAELWLVACSNIFTHSTVNFKYKSVVNIEISKTVKTQISLSHKVFIN